MKLVIWCEVSICDGTWSRKILPFKKSTACEDVRVTTTWAWRINYMVWSALSETAEWSPLHTRRVFQMKIFCTLFTFTYFFLMQSFTPAMFFPWAKIVAPIFLDKGWFLQSFTYEFAVTYECYALNLSLLMCIDAWLFHNFVSLLVCKNI